MVKNKISRKSIKSIFCIILIMFCTANLFCQNTENSTNTTVNSFENDTSYFSDASSENVQNTYKAPSTAKMIIKMIVVLVLVIAALYGIMLFFKKKNNPTQSDDDFLRRVSSLSLSPGKSIEIVTLVDRGFILGVTDSNINLISEITDKEMISALNLNFDKKQNTKKPMNFSDVLEMFMPGGPKTKTNMYSSSERVVQNLTKNEAQEDSENKSDSGGE